MNLLPDPGDDGKVLREVGGQDSGDPVGVQVLKLAQFWKTEESLMTSLARKAQMTSYLLCYSTLF